jgi:NADPH-dependent ferric siderophore reductase
VTAPLVQRSPTHHGTVVAARQLTPRMRRVTVRSETMLGVEIRPAQDVELHLREAGGRRVKRRYTIRYARPDHGELDLDVVLHGAGPGAQWGESAEPGDEIDFQGPRGKLELRGAATHLLVGDESALPAIATIAESLPTGEQAVSVIEVQDASDALDVPGDVRWLHRGAHSAGTADLLLPAVRSVKVTGEIRAYLLGETRSMVAVRANLEERGVPHDSVFLKGYWNIARPDRIAGQAPRA